MHDRLGKGKGKSKLDSEFRSLLDRALANPVATGEGKLISREAITGDRFGPNGCIHQSVYRVHKRPHRSDHRFGERPPPICRMASP